MSDWREALANFAENLSECVACCQYVIPCSLGCCRNILDNILCKCYLETLFNYKFLKLVFLKLVFLKLVLLYEAWKSP